MAGFNTQNNFGLKISIKFPVFNRVFDKIYRSYKTKAGNYTMFVHASLAILFADTNAVPCYVRVSRGSHPGQHRIQR
jgi:hypothetical protein